MHCQPNSYTIPNKCRKMKVTIGYRFPRCTRPIEVWVVRAQHISHLGVSQFLSDQNLHCGVTSRLHRHSSSRISSQVSQCLIHVHCDCYEVQCRTTESLTYLYECLVGACYESLKLRSAVRYYCVPCRLLSARTTLSTILKLYASTLRHIVNKN